MSARGPRSAASTARLGTILEPFRTGLREHLLEYPRPSAWSVVRHASPSSRRSGASRAVHHARDGDVIGFARCLSRSGLRPLLCVASRPSLAVSFAEACEERWSGEGPCLVDLARGPEGFPRGSAAGLSLARTVPGATVIDCGDAVETRTVLSAVAGVRGPLYIRALSGCLVPILFEAPLEPCRARLLSRGRDLCLVSSSSATWTASEAALRLRAVGLSVPHLHVSTLRPLDDPVVPPAIAGTRGVLTLEPPSLDSAPCSRDPGCGGCAG